ncbi:hypothetical protein NBT05_02170 [Aquimarina sp. ERC-38]|uniref:hypothetical protein n=1 Tax=Aquimarina sp. ERC-38 TaxID=2949996 RepID=UPI00224667CC|nr:hypothetical protein [Aquimarina sp. ERC-38]UZO81290.1 hypothetical protein NBT05_02170 [Aquimarina sp. ERC-38]
MGGVNYEIQDRNLESRKHTFDYNFCKKKYNEYVTMGKKKFIKSLKNPQKLGEIGHLSCFILWIKNKERYEYRDSLGDYGLIHLLFHCAENSSFADKEGGYIFQLFKEDIALL